MAVYSARAILRGTGHDVWKMVESGIADRERPTLINARTPPVDA
jgi:hypothetical protein